MTLNTKLYSQDWFPVRRKSVFPFLEAYIALTFKEKRAADKIARAERARAERAASIIARAKREADFYDEFESESDEESLSGLKPEAEVDVEVEVDKKKKEGLIINSISVDSE